MQIKSEQDWIHLFQRNENIERGKRKFLQEKAGVIGQNISNEVDTRRKTSVQIKKKRETKKQEWRAVVVAKLVEQSIPKPEIHGSNPAIDKFYFLSTILNLY